MDGVDHDTLLNGTLAGVVRVDRALGEWLVAGDEDGFVGPAAVVPAEFVQRLANHRAAIFVTAAGGEFEKLLGDLIEVAGEGQHLADVVGADAEAVVAIFIEGNLHDGRFIALLRVVELVDDFPELAFRLFDEAVHAVAGVQQDGDLHQRFVVADGFVTGRFCRMQQGCAGDETEGGVAEELGKCFHGNASLRAAMKGVCKASVK